MVDNPQTIYIWLWNAFLNFHLNRNVGPKDSKSPKLSIFLIHISLYREREKIHVWVLRPSSTGQVKLELEDTEMVAMFTKIAKQDIPKRHQNKIYFKWYRIWVNIAELYVVIYDHVSTYSGSLKLYVMHWLPGWWEDD